MVDGAVVIGPTKAMVGFVLVRADRGARFDVFVDDAFNAEAILSAGLSGSCEWQVQSSGPLPPAAPQPL